MKKRKYYAITTKRGKRIPAQRTTPDEVVNIPLHFFYLEDKGGVNLVASQSKFVFSKHSSISLVEKHVYQLLSGKDLNRVIQYCCAYENVPALLKHFNKEYPKHTEFKIDSGMVNVEVIEA